MAKQFTVKLDETMTNFLEEVASIQGVPCTEILREALNYYMTTGGGDRLLKGVENGFERGRAVAISLNLAMTRDLATRMPRTYAGAQRLLAEMAADKTALLSTHLDALDDEDDVAAAGMARKSRLSGRPTGRKRACLAAEHGKGISWDTLAIAGLRSRWHVCGACGKATPEGGRVRSTAAIARAA